MSPVLRRFGLLLLGGAMWLAPANARAGNNGYFTTYNSTVEKSEFELMLMNDLTAPSKFNRSQGQGDYLSQMVELEYGVTSQFATELMVEWFADLETDRRRFTGFRWEARYRLFKGHVPLNPMIYAEFEDLDPETRYKMEVSGWVKPPYKEKDVEAARERVLESRLVLSEDFGPLDVAVNGIVESDLSSGVTAFGYSAGIMWMPGHGGSVESCPPPPLTSEPTPTYSCPMHPGVTSAAPGKCPQCGMPLVARSTPAAKPASSSGCGCATSMPGCHCGHCSGAGGACDCSHAGMVGVGLELFGALGDTRAFALQGPRQEHYLGPILMYHFTPRLMVHSQLAIGLTAVSDEIARLNIGYEF